MTTKIDPIFLIKQKNSNLFLHVFENPHTDEDEDEVDFCDIEINARITSVMGLTDDVFNDEYDANLLSFSSEEDARSHLKYVEVNPNDVEVVKLNISASFEVV